MIDFSVFKNRRKNLIEKIVAKHSGKDGIILLFAGFENCKYKFRQESSFYYLTALEEPAVALSVNFDNSAVLYTPQYAESRAKWVSSILHGASKDTLTSMGISSVEHLGQACKGYSFNGLCNAEEYENIISKLKTHVASGKFIYTTYSRHYVEQSLLIDRLIGLVPEIKSAIIDISDIIGQMRRIKSKDEIERIYNAGDCTQAAHEAVIEMIEAGKREYEIQAGIEFIFRQSGGSAAFPSIVAAGANATTLHYTENNSILKNGELLLVDIGAEIDYYCADITRTYPVSGLFTKRQREIYTIVLEAQKYLQDYAKPGYWLNNKDNPSKSLQHLALKFFEKAGYSQYFTHSIGHYLGLDVHDVGSYAEPLQEGDVITIEPGLYIPEESIGVRIEDNYWIINDDNVCLSEELPKEIDDIEDAMN